MEESKADAAEKVTDLMEALQASLEGAGKHRPGNRKRGGRLKTQKADADDLGARSKEELYELAQELDIRGRSKMSQAELAKAVEKAGSKGRRKAS